MEEGSSLGRGSAKKGEKNGSELEPKIEPFVSERGHDPKELRSWAKRTGFVSTFSGEAETGTERRELSEGRRRRNGGGGVGSRLDLEKGIAERSEPSMISPKIEIDPILGRRTTRKPPEIQQVGADGDGGGDGGGFRVAMDAGGGLSNGSEAVAASAAEKIGDGESRGVDGGWHPSSSPSSSPRMVLGLKDNPGYVAAIFYGLQHYLSLAGSIIFIPLLFVPAMGGTDKDTATVISTMLLLSGTTTLLHTHFGTRLPLVQGSSFVYLAPALIIMNSRELRNLTEHRFRHIMRELQGAIIIGSIFQCIMGLSGMMSLLLRFINPVVVVPTVVAMGLAFFSFGFPQAGACVEISLPEIFLVLLFTLYLRGVSIFGNRIFRIYAVPLSVLVIWAYAFFLTAGGAYNYKGCRADIPSSNILIDACRKHAYTMKHCRTDVSNAMKMAAWVRIPYPLQWGVPLFRLRTSIIMICVSLVASVDSVGTYHIVSMRINSKAPTPGVVSRGIGVEGFCSVLAGLWGSGTGSTTLIENVHTINVTKVASRKVIEVGALFLIVFSFIGKVGAILASIPQALAAAVLCFMWGLMVALGVSTLQYNQTAASFRNISIVGASLFLGLSVPAYFQQYLPEVSLILPAYLIPYSAASDGPIRSGSNEVDFALNGLLSLNMVVAFLIALLLDNTAPATSQERGRYIWSTDPDPDPDYYTLSLSLSRKISCCFGWAKCLGVGKRNNGTDLG
ncbi:nucleobase-ascorbate transporter 11 isoform X2 [Andrographis paniculata]|uniref:nucleobase-ascorbate transporter 11 isoform X2 n=1 Tax=Andrographis paniculata TaxID=175694 RepID=UPI0021E72A0D|nr:nucleobase-ascorbate transporter 11 isoform X2 [Andrographis paniculata]